MVYALVPSPSCSRCWMPLNPNPSQTVSIFARFKEAGGLLASLEAMAAGTPSTLDFQPAKHQDLPLHPNLPIIKTLTF